MKNDRSSRSRKSRPANILPNYLDTLESRLLLSSTHSAMALPHAHPKTPAANVAPSKLKVSLSSDFLNPNTSTSLTGTFADSNAADTHTVVINWGDGNASSIGLAAGILTIPATTHSYTADGTYTITTTVSDPSHANTSTTSGVLVLNTFDIVPSITKLPKISGAIITGTSASGTVNVTLVNNGTLSSPAATLSVFLHPLAGGNDVNLTTTPVSIPSIKPATFKNGVTKPTKISVPASVTIPLTLAPGSYHIIVVVNDTSPNGSAAQLNNTLPVEILGIPITITATAGNVSVNTGLSVTGLTSPIVAGTAATGKLTLTFNNTGNLPTPNPGEFNIALFLHPSSGPNVPLTTLTNQTVPIIKAGSNQTLSATIPLSAVATAAIPPGNYLIEATLTPTNGTPGSPFTIQGPQITFSASNTGGTALLKHGNTVKFDCDQQLTGQNFLERGFFTTNVKGITGSYVFTPAGLILSYVGGDTDTLAVTLTGSQLFMDPSVDGNPTTVIFSTDPTGSFASILALGSSTPFFAKLG